MTVRPGAIWYWLAVAISVVLVAVAIGWNGWTFNQHAKAQRQLDSFGVDLSAPEQAPPVDAELELLLEADARGILEESFQALLTEPQKRALALARRDRLAERADARKPR